MFCVVRLVVVVFAIFFLMKERIFLVCNFGLLKMFPRENLIYEKDCFI